MTIRTLALALLAASFVGSAASAADAPRATLSTGVVQGAVDDGTLAFKGIPYAAPPIGTLRWRAPRPAPAWTGVRDASAYGAACPQPALFKDAWAQVGRKSEDCLFLNVWRPADASKGLPVMVYFHGGAFSLGSAGVPLYDGANLARRGAVIVTMNYRLGRLGFFAHPALTAEDPNGLLGNYGLMDQIEALRWVQRNISAFGGDPRNVTIFGESAGAGSVQLFVGTPATDGLFAKAISESGSGANVLLPLKGPAPSAEAEGLALTDKLGMKGVTAAQLRAIPADQIATGAGFPMIDGKVVIYSPGDAFRRGVQKAVPMIIGANSDEETLPGWSPAVAKAVLGDAYAPLLARYAREKITPAAPEMEMAAEVNSVEPSRFVGDFQAKKGVKVFSYWFDHLPVAARATGVGTPHGGEVEYVFGNEPAGEAWDDTDRRIAKLMGDYWVRFARTGDPNGGDAPVWKASSGAAPQNLIVDAQPHSAPPTALQQETKRLALQADTAAWEKSAP